MTHELPSLGSLARRRALIGGSSLSAGLLFSGAALSAAKATRTVLTDRTTMNSITFKNGAIDMAGNVYLPKDFDESRTHPAIVVVHPGGGVKEQTAGLYAQKLAAQGFVTLAFDARTRAPAAACPASSMTRCAVSATSTARSTT